VADLAPLSARARDLFTLVETGEVHTLEAAARQLSLSRQRVHQLWKRYGITIPKTPKALAVRTARRCRNCGATLLGRYSLCPDCRSVQVTCPSCGQNRATLSRLPVRGDAGREARLRWSRTGQAERWPAAYSGRRRALPRSSGVVAVTCARCQQVRLMRASEAKGRKTGLCLSCYRLRGAKRRPSEVGRHGRRKQVHELRQLISEMVSAGGRAELVPGPNQSIWSLKTAVWRARLVAGRSGGSPG
jgi:hypothetical protein